MDLDAVARNAAGEAVDVGDRLRWLTPDTTVALDSATGLVTPRAATGTARIQVGIFGIDTVVTAPSSLVLTLTAKADTLLLLSPDSVEILRDRFDTAPIQLRLDGGSPLVPVVGRPVTFRVIEPAPSDSPAVVFASGRAADSLTTTTTGVTATVRGAPGRPIPDRAVIEINAWRATGAAIPGSGRRVVVRFRHQ